MAIYNGNSPYLTIGGQSMATPFVSCAPEFKNKTQDVSAGAGLAHEQKAAGLSSTTWKVEVGYITGSNIAATLPVIKQGTIQTLEWGPESNVVGKPRHVQSCVVQSVATKQDVEKGKVVLTVTLEGADVPTFDMFAGATY